MRFDPHVPAATDSVVGTGPAATASGRSKNGVVEGVRLIAVSFTGGKMSNQCNAPNESTNGPIECGSMPATEAGFKPGLPTRKAGRLRAKTSGTVAEGAAAAAASTNMAQRV